MNRKIKNFVLWNHTRETSIYVVFCLAIVAFIFLTPKSWFDKTERLATQTSRLIVQQSDYSPEMSVLSNRVKELSGNPNAEIVSVREARNGRGERVYEIDFR